MRSSTPLPQCSVKRVQDMPTIATRSLIPCDPMSGAPSSEWAGLPKVVVDAICARQPAEHHLHSVSDLHVGGVDVRELNRQPTAAVEVDDGEHEWRTGGVRQSVDSE